MQPTFKLAPLALLSAFSLQPSALLGQGSLTPPPGAPAPTMKTLAQIEARTPIAAAPFTIAQPGSYYLTTNLTVSSGDAITITADGVTLDLNGFTLTSIAATANGTAILLTSGRRDITIFNGHIRRGVTNDGSGVFSGSGFGHGINYSATPPMNVLVSRVTVSGCLGYGIFLNNVGPTVVEACVVRTMGLYGILASTIKTSTATECKGTAVFGKQVSDCRGKSLNGSGIVATTAQNCHGVSTTGFGIEATMALNCYGTSTSGSGVQATTAENCYGVSESGYGVYATTAQNCRGNSNSGTGIYASRTALNSHGTSSTGTGLFARTAAFCTGAGPGGSAIQATVANGCSALNGTNNITHKYNMP